MKKTNKSLVLMIITLSIIFGTLCGGALKVNALENTMTSSTYGDDNYCPRCPCPRYPCPRGEGGLLKESINELKESGNLTDDDVKNINSYMIKDRESREAEIKEKIYKMECEKIDKMVSENVISKEKGQKLKETVKENIKDMKRNIKRLNSK